MKKVCILLAAFIFSIFLLACKTEKPGKNDPSKSSRFVTVDNTSLIYRIVADKETGVMYAVSIGGYNGGNFTLLVDREGKPLIWEGNDG